MKRRMMAFLMAGTLLLTLGIATMAVYAMSDGGDEPPTIDPNRQAQIRQQAADRHGGIGFTEGDTARPGSSTVADAEGSDAGDSATETSPNAEATAGSKPGVSVGTGGILQVSGTMEAGGLRGGVVLRDDPAQMGGAGGLCSPPHHECGAVPSQVLAGGLRGGVVLNTDPSLAQ